MMMKLEEIAAGIDEHCRDWGQAHVAELDRITETPQIAQQIVHFLEESAKHPRSITGTPAQAVRSALKLSGLSNFRFGLLVGLLLWRPDDVTIAPNLLPDPDPDRVNVRCESCVGTGVVCHVCGSDAKTCDCGTTLFSPVRCSVCNGDGWL